MLPAPHQTPNPTNPPHPNPQTVACFTNVAAFKDITRSKIYQLTFSARFGNRASSAFFISRVIKLLINSTLSLPHPSSQAPFLSTIMLGLICL